MIEEIKLIVDALEGVTNGALWALGAYFVFRIIVATMIAGTVVFIVKTGAELARAAIQGPNINDWNIYQWDDREGGVNACFSKSSMKLLLRTIQGDEKMIHDKDILDAAAKIEGKRNGT